MANNGAELTQERKVRRRECHGCLFLRFMNFRALFSQFGWIKCCSWQFTSEDTTPNTRYGNPTKVISLPLWHFAKQAQWHKPFCTEQIWLSSHGQAFNGAEFNSWLFQVIAQWTEMSYGNSQALHTVWKITIIHLPYTVIVRVK